MRRELSHRPVDLSSLPTIRSIRSRGHLRVLVNSYTPGFSLRSSEGGQRAGFEIDIVRCLTASIFGQVAGIDSHVEFVETETGNRLDALVERQVDMIVSNLTDTSDRRTRIDFAGHYVSMRYAPLLGPCSPEVRDMSDLAGLRVAVEADSVDEALLARMAPSAEIVPMHTPSEWIAALIDGRVQVFWGDTAVDVAYARELSANIRQGSLRAGIGHSAIGINKDADDLRVFVDDFMRDMFESGRLTDSLRRWDVGSSLARSA